NEHHPALYHQLHPSSIYPSIHHLSICPPLIHPLVHLQSSSIEHILCHIGRCTHSPTMLAMHSPPPHPKQPHCPVSPKNAASEASSRRTRNSATLMHIWAVQGLGTETVCPHEPSIPKAQPHLLQRQSHSKQPTQKKHSELELSPCPLFWSQESTECELLTPSIIFPNEVVPETPAKIPQPSPSRSLIVKLNLPSNSHNHPLDDVQMINRLNPSSRALHPFFMGKKARDELKKSLSSFTPKDNLEAEEGPPRKRRKSKDPADPANGSYPESQPSHVSIEIPNARLHQSPKSLHPFFTSKSASDCSSSSVQNLGLSMGLTQATYRLTEGSSASFPNSENMHVRGLCTPAEAVSLPSLKQSDQKGKQKELIIPPEEYIINKLVQKLQTSEKLERKYPHKIFCDPSKLQYLADNTLCNSPENPKLSRVYSSLPLLKPHDCALRETQLWTNKYAPIMSSEILQANQCSLTLKTWLERLQLGVKLDRRIIAKKPKKLSNYDIEMDGFVIDDEDEIEDSEDDDYLDKPKMKKPPKTDNKILDQSNYIILAGPHGIGKTASVYACANELGFEVFEVHSGNRRCGKDLLDQVGEVAQSHLVGSGKQSLILIEEVDVLFEEDKGFWSSVMELIEKSRRPIVLTCNDVELLAEELDPRTILTYTSPPTELSVDYLYTLCLNEGHLISTDAILKLFLLNGGDLRKTISQLQLWCQMGVGCDRAGTSWFYILGVDGDEPMRVISTETYSLGMGFQGNNEILDDNILERLQKIQVSDETPHEAKHNTDVLGVLDRYFEAVSFMDGELSSRRTIYNVVEPPLPKFDESIPANPFATKVRPRKLDILQGYTHLVQPSGDLVPPCLGELDVSYKLFETARSLFQSEIEAMPYEGINVCEPNRAQMFEMLVAEKTAERVDISEIYATSLEPLSTPSDWIGPQFPHNITLLPLPILATEVGCYIRSIILADQEIEKEVYERSNLLTFGGKSRKRHTRAAKAAEEGIGRRRKKLHLDEHKVLATWDL
ncbi:Telomere length regulation protein elg1, partial [Neolecta irregularis DAH-3]